MGDVLKFPNLGQGNPQSATGTQVGVSTCLDVAPKNTAGTPLFVSSTPLSVKEKRYHDTASTAINASGGAWIEVETAAAIANTIAALKGAWNGDEPVEIGKGANAGAVTSLVNVGAGEDFEYGVSLVATDKIWVRSLSANVPTGRLTLNLMG
jgi:hypothetical protein